MTQIVYLTGAPATGKSTLLHAILARRSDVVGFSYGEVLTTLVRARISAGVDQNDVRRNSASLVSAADVEATDESLISFIEDNRRQRHVIIDSHPVTKEQYGFRITAFSQERLRRLGLTAMVCLYCDPRLTRSRILQDSGGRPMPTPFEAEVHSHLQGAVVATYGILLGLPVRYLDSGRSVEALQAEFETILKP